MQETILEDFKYRDVEDGYKLNEPAQFFIGVFPDEDIIYETCTLSKTGWLYCDINTFWNGADVAIDTKTNIRAALSHDIPIRMSRAGLIILSFARKIRVDFVYFRLAIEDGMSKFRAILHFLLIMKNPWHKKGK